MSRHSPFLSHRGPRRTSVATLPTYFTDFLAGIRPTPSQLSGMASGHQTLRDRLNDFESLQSILVSDFLQGSYRRSTAIRPAGSKRSDVDIIVVTNLSEAQYPDPDDAMALFIPFMDKFYPDKWELQGRSFGIELTHVSLDVVITSAPSEAQTTALHSQSVRVIDELADLSDWRLTKSWLPLELRAAGTERLMLKAAAEAEWKLEPLRIPDRDAGTWEDTHPLEQIRWTHAKNASCNTHYVNVVKAIKWWRRVKRPDPKYPKGYPVEHLIGYGCPDSITSVADGVTRALEKIRDDFATDALLERTPFLPNHGLPNDNVLERISGADFKAFHGHVSEAASLARKALDEEDKKKSAGHWRELFGDKFPEWRGGSSNSSGSGGGAGGIGAAKSYSDRNGPSDPGRGRFG